VEPRGGKLAAYESAAYRQPAYSKTIEQREIKRLEFLEGLELTINLGGGSANTLRVSFYYAHSGRRLERWYEDIIAQPFMKDGEGSGFLRRGGLYVSGGAVRQIVEKAVRRAGAVIVKPH